MFDHVGGHGLSAVENAFEVNGNNHVESFFAHLFHQFAIFHFHELGIAGDTSVVDQNIHMTVFGSHTIDPLLSLSAIAHVHFAEHGVRSERGEQRVAEFF
ncbi:hypothetical protein SDC9_198363 [bioreactor metagenome]|uniref:Uncharacterized protein n=1 Tax=bioreactor metagenome TaxID=1076179 RepID=A0A645IHY7_9ZZZZ